MSIPNPIGRDARFYFNTKPAIKGKIIYVPLSAGDCWVIETPQGETLYIQTFSYMYLYPEKDND